MAEFYDLPGAMLQSTQTGAALGQAMAHNYFQGQEQSLRMQQFQSERALRQLQERQASEMLDWTLRQHHQAIQDEANTQKANAVFQTLTTPVLQMPVMGPPSDEGQTSLGTAPVPNPMYEPDTGKAMIKAFGGTAKNPIEFGKLLMDAATVNYHNAEAERQKALAAEEAKGGFQATPQTVTMPDGTKINGIRDSKNHWAPVVDPNVQTLTNPTTGETTSILRSGLNNAKVIPQDTGKRMAAHALEQQAILAPDLAEQNPDAPAGMRRIAPAKQQEFMARMAIPVAARTKAEESLTKMDSSIATLQDSLRIISSTPQALGPSGYLRSKAEIAKGMLGIPGAADVTTARDALEQNFISMAGGMRADLGGGRLSN